MGSHPMQTGRRGYRPSSEPTSPPSSLLHLWVEGLKRLRDLRAMDPGTMMGGDRGVSAPELADRQAVECRLLWGELLADGMRRGDLLAIRMAEWETELAIELALAGAAAHEPTGQRTTSAVASRRAAGLPGGHPLYGRRHAAKARLAQASTLADRAERAAAELAAVTVLAREILARRAVNARNVGWRRAVSAVAGEHRGRCASAHRARQRAGAQTAFVDLSALPGGLDRATTLAQLGADGMLSSLGLTLDEGGDPTPSV